MKLGMFMMPLHPPGRNAWETLAEDREAILLADRLGFEEAFVGEHVTDLAENVTSSLMFLASVAHDTTQIRLGTGTINMPNTHPANVAAQVAMLDHLLEGRLHLRDQPGRPDVGRRGVRELREGPQCDLPRGDRHGARDLEARRRRTTCTASTSRLHRQDDDPRDRPGDDPQAVPEAASADRGHGRGAALEGRDRGGQARLDADLGELPAARVGRTHWPRYAEGREAVGATADPADWRVAKCIFVADDEATAQRYGKSPDGPYHFYFKQLLRKLVTAGGRSNLFKLDQACPTPRSRRSTSRINSCSPVPSTASSSNCSRSASTTGDFGTLLYACKDWKDEALGRRSMQLLAEQVMPKVNAALAAGAR